MATANEFAVIPISQSISNVCVIDTWLVQLEIAINCTSLVAYVWRDPWRPGHGTQYEMQKKVMVVVAAALQHGRCFDQPGQY